MAATVLQRSHGRLRLGMRAASSTAAVRLSVERLPDHLDRLYRAAYALSGSHEDAQDLVQDTYDRVLRRPRLLRRDEDLAYLLRTLRNTWVDTVRARAARPSVPSAPESLEWVVDRDAEPGVTAVELREVYAGIAALSVPLREAIVAVDVVGLSYKQAARALGVPKGTIMSRLHRARDEVMARVGER
jgi:RNA polymerase sigma-70 factor (ECF subfamily)